MPRVGTLVLFIYLGGEDGPGVAGAIQESDVELDRYVRAGWDLVGTRSSGVELASLSATTALQVHTLLYCEQPHPLGEGSLYLGTEFIKNIEQTRDILYLNRF